MRFTSAANSAAKVKLAARVARMTVAAAILAALAAAVPSTASADPPTRITVVAVFEPITYGENAYVNGQLLGDNQGAQTVVLEQSAPPFTEWVPVAEASTDPVGYYSFKLHPTQTLQYRTSSQGVLSERAVQVAVAPRIKLRAAAAGKSSVRFSGSFAPALEGQEVQIQRRVSGGGYATVARARLRSGKTFQGRIRARRALTLRAYFPNDGARLNGFSNLVKVTPGAKAAAARATACPRPSITRIATKPEPPVAGQPTVLRVTAAMPAGRLYAVDVLWGERDKRDHLTLAPALRKPKVTFTLRHRYAAAGDYGLRVRVFGRTGGCKSSRTRRPHLQVIAAQP